MPAITAPPPPAISAQPNPDDIRRRAALPLTEFEIAAYAGERLIWAGPLRIAGQSPGFRTGGGQGQVNIWNSGPVAASCHPGPLASGVEFKETFGITMEPNQYLGGPGEFTISVAWSRPSTPLTCSIRENKTSEFNRHFDLAPGRTVTLTEAGMRLSIHRR